MKIGEEVSRRHVRALGADGAWDRPHWTQISRPTPISLVTARSESNSRDEQTKHAAGLTPPRGCFFTTGVAPLGGSWVVARCNSLWDRCSSIAVQRGFMALGNQWIEFSFGCGYHAGIVTVALQQIQSGQVIVGHADLELSAT
jgi:hypothetical protein